MANFEETLSAVPTTTVGASPAIIDTSALAVAKLAEAFTGQFLDFKQKKAKQKKVDAEGKVLASLQSDILALGTAADQGSINLTEANVRARKRTQQALAQNPNLSKEIGKVFTQTRTSSGLSSGKTNSQLVQEERVRRSQDLIDRGWLASGATLDEADALFPVLKQQLQAEDSMKQHVAEVSAIQGDLSLNAAQRDAKLKTIGDKAKKDIRTVANSQYSRVVQEVNRLNRLVGTDDGSRQSVFEQLEVLEREIRENIPQVSRSFLDPKEVQAMMGGVFEPIDILKKRINENRTAKWANDNIESTRAIATEKAFQDPKFLLLHTFSRNIGEATVARYSTNVLYQNHMSDLAAGNGGKGTGDVGKEVKVLESQTIKEAAANKELSPEDNITLSNMIEGTIKDLVTDDAQGRISRPADLSAGIDMLSDTNVNRKVASGEIVLDDATLIRGQRIVQDTFISKLAPTIGPALNFQSNVFEGKAIGQVYNLAIENGVLTVKISPEGQALVEAHRKKIQDEAFEGPTRGTAGRLAVELQEVVAEVDGLQRVVAAANKSARAMATLSKTTKIEPFLQPLIEGLLGGEVEEEPVIDSKTQELIDTLPEEAAERFNSLDEEQKARILSMSPDEIRNIVSAFAPT